MLTTVVLLADGQRLGIEVVRLPLGDSELCGDFLVREPVTFLHFKDLGDERVLFIHHFPDCKYLHLGSSQRILVYFYKTTNRAFAEAQWEYINNVHSRGYSSTRCMVPGQRKAFVRCKDTNKCSECPYGRTPETRQASLVSLDDLVESGYEPEAADSAEQQAVAKMEYAEIRARMDAEDPRIARALETKVLLGDTVTKIAADLGVSEPRVYQLLRRAKEIGREYRMNE